MLLVPSRKRLSCLFSLLFLYAQEFLSRHIFSLCVKDSVDQPDMRKSFTLSVTCFDHFLHVPLSWNGDWVSSIISIKPLSDVPQKYHCLNISSKDKNSLYTHTVIFPVEVKRNIRRIIMQLWQFKVVTTK